MALGPNPSDDKVHFSNVYDENIYQTAGLPNNYGKGTRLSNLRSNFDDGVTIEFWLKKDAFDTNLTDREVVVDIWNNYLSSSEDCKEAAVMPEPMLDVATVPEIFPECAVIKNGEPAAVASNSTVILP